MEIELNKDEVLVYRQGDGRNNTIYKVGKTVEAQDWDGGKKVCGGGLHGLLWGAGDISLLGNGDSILIKTTKNELVELDGKCKYRSGLVVYRGKRRDAIEIIQHHAPAGIAINFATQTAGDGSTQKAGDGSTQTAGYGSTQTAGYGSTQTAGLNSVQIGWWYDDDGNYRVATRVVTKEFADKTYRFEKGEWKLLSAPESAAKKETTDEI